MNRKSPYIYFLFFVSIFYSGCAHLDTKEGRLLNDVNFLLEEQLLDGEVATWSDKEEPNVTRRLAIFLTCSEEGDLCRYYYTETEKKGRKNPKVFGISCRKYRRNWEPVIWNKKQDISLHKRSHSVFYSFNKLNENTPPPVYKPSYRLPAVLAKRVAKAESKYKLPLRKMIDNISKKRSFNPKLIHAVVYQESRYNPRAVSPMGAKGLMQLMPPTAKEVGVKNPFNPYQNLSGGTLYLRRQLDRKAIKGNIALALASYNAGYGNVCRRGRCKVPNIQETRHYVKNIMKLYKSN